jgi:hypothetical protein
MESFIATSPVVFGYILRLRCIVATTPVYRFVSGCISVHPHGRQAGQPFTLAA